MTFQVFQFLTLPSYLNPAGLSVLIPVYNWPVEGLVRDLLAQRAAWPGPVEILLLDEERFEQRILGEVAASPAWPSAAVGTINRARHIECIDGEDVPVMLARPSANPVVAAEARAPRQAALATDRPADA